MTLDQFAAEMTRRGCVSDGKNFCGSFNSYPFSATFLKGSAKSTTFLLKMQFDKRPKKTLFKQLRKQMVGFANLQFVNSQLPYTIMYNVTIPGDSFSTSFDRLITEATNIAKTLGLTIAANCMLCKKPGCDSFAFYGGVYTPVHAACVQEKALKTQAQVQKNETSGSYALGIVGAVLGALVGTLPTVATIYFINTIYSLLFALIPLCAYLGYKLLGGKMTRVTLVVVIVISVLMAPVVTYLGNAMLLYFENNYMLLPDEYIAFALAYSEVMGEILFSLFYIGLGILMVSGIISRNNSHAWKESTFSSATLRPINPAAAAPAASAPQPVASAPAPVDNSTNSPQ